MSSRIKASRSYGGIDAEDRRLERRLRLIEAAIRVYGEVGYRNATVKAVCEAAKLTERYFYESFPNSEALLIAAYVHVTDALHADMAAAGAAAASNNEKRIRAVLTTYFTRLRDHPRSARVFLLEMGGISTKVDGACVKALDAMGRILAPPSARLSESAHASLASVGMIGAVVHIALRWVSRNYPQSIDEVVAAAETFCLALVSNAGDA